MNRSLTPAYELVASDFDGTRFDTLARSPNGIGVNEAYGFAVEQVCGAAAHTAFEKMGGHGNRTPFEIAQSIVGKASVDNITELAEAITTKKLEKLCSEIGKKATDGSVWPSPLAGFMDVWSEVLASTKTAVISAGHTSFIERVYALYNVEYPDVLITCETVSSIGLPELAKPDKRLLVIAQKMLRLSDDVKAVYIGDDEKKDGGLAKNAACDFILIDGNIGWATAKECLLLQNAA